MFRKVALAAAAAAAVATPAAAENNVYASAGYTHYDLEDVTVGGLTGRLGFKFNENFGVEGEASFGVKDDDINVGPPVGNIQIELDNAYGIYGVGFLPAGENADLFVRLGYASLEITGSAGGAAASAEADGFAAGVGGQYFFTPNFGVRGEYTRIEGDDGGADTFTASAVLKFGGGS